MQLIRILEGEKISSAEINEVDNSSCKDDAWTRTKTDAECLGLFNLDNNLSMSIFIQLYHIKNISVLEESHYCIFSLLSVVVGSNET